MLPSFTEQRYVEALRSAVTELALEGNVAIHGRGSHLFIPPHIPALHVFVTAPESLRRQRIAAQEGLGLKNAERLLRRVDRESCAIFKHLLGCDLLDTGRYDLILNVGRLTFETAAQAVALSLESASPITRRGPNVPAY